MKKKNIFKKIIGFIIGILLFIFLGLFSSLQNKPNINISEDRLIIYYFNVEQADCSLIINNGETMLIDGGNELDSENLIHYMNTLGITKLDYVIATHADGDHIGGLDRIIQAFPTKNIYMPNTNKVIKELTELQDVAKDKINTPSQNHIFYVGNIKCTVMYIGDATKVSENNSSIVLELEYDNISCLFMGDAEREVEESINWNDIDILKVSHHGSNTGTTQKFLEKSKPEYAIISVGANNNYSLPSTEVLNRLEAFNSIIYRTDLDGTIILSSDGTSYNFSFDKTSLDGNT